jgi:hypothetical protein
MHLLEFIVGQLFNADELVLRIGSPNDFVEFRLHGGAVAVLRVLNDEDHKESDDRGAGIDHELPCFGKPEKWPGSSPEYDKRDAGEEGDWIAGNVSDPVGELRKQLVHLTPSGVAIFGWRRCDTRLDQQQRPFQNGGENRVTGLVLELRFIGLSETVPSRDC